jgi:hypothetical protein
LEERNSESGRPPHFFGWVPRAILDSRRPRFSRLPAKFDAPFGDITFEHGENLAIARDIQNSQP